MRKTSAQKGGFTLIEMLVVVAVVSVLSAVILSNVGSARQKVRTSDMNNQIKAVITAFNMAINDGNTLPATPGWVCVSKACSGFGGATANATVDAYLAPYLPAKPDISSDGTYVGATYSYAYMYTSLWFPFIIAPIGPYVSWFLEPGKTCPYGAYTNNSASFTSCYYYLSQ